MSLLMHIPLEEAAGGNVQVKVTSRLEFKSSQHRSKIPPSSSFLLLAKGSGDAEDLQGNSALMFTPGDGSMPANCIPLISGPKKRLI